MENPNIRTVAIVLAVLAVVSVLGIAVMKMSAAPAERPDNRTVDQKIDAVETNSSLQSSSARSFVQNERAQRAATRAAEDFASER